MYNKISELQLVLKELIVSLLMNDFIRWNRKFILSK